MTSNLARFIERANVSDQYSHIFPLVTDWILTWDPVPQPVLGFILGIAEVIFAVSLGSLIFSGDLATFLPSSIDIVLFTCAVILIVTSLVSKVSGVIRSTQDTTSVIPFS